MYSTKNFFSIEFFKCVEILVEKKFKKIPKRKPTVVADFETKNPSEMDFFDQKRRGLNLTSC